MQTLLVDLRYGLRVLAKNPGFTAVAVLTLALGIGANTAIFSVVNAALLHPLPFQNPDGLVIVYETDSKTGDREAFSSPPNFVDWRDHNRVFEYMAAWRTWFYALTGGSEPEQIRGVRVSASFFPLLGVKASLGRTFLPQEEQVGHDQVVVLSYSLWERRFGGDRSLIGKTLTLDSKSFTVIGVLPADFQFSTTQSDLWMPFAFAASELARDNHSIMVHARLKRGVSLKQAQAEMNTLARQLEQEYPKTYPGASSSLPTHSTGQPRKRMTPRSRPTGHTPF